MWEDIKTVLEFRRNGEAMHISYDHLAARLLAAAGDASWAAWIAARAAAQEQGEG